jgi:hypothetical protein
MKKYLILDLDRLEIRDIFGRKMLFERKSTASQVAENMCFNSKIIEIKEQKNVK